MLSITPDGAVWVESKSVASKDLESTLAQELRANPARKILLKGDASLTVGDVRATMDVVKRSGAKSVALGVREQKD